MSILDIPTARVFRPLLAPRRFKGARGGRGSGKSHFFAELLVEEAVAQRIRGVCLREVQNSIRDSSKALIEAKIREHGLDHLFDVTDQEIRGPNDSLFIFRGLLSHTATTIKSLEDFNRAWLDEGQAVSQRSLDILTPTLRAPGAEIWISWNPEDEGDPVEKFFGENVGHPDFVCVDANYSDNPWFPDSLRSDMERDRLRDPDKYAHVWAGGYRKISEAAVFKNWKVQEFTAPASARFRYGADWGFKDPTVLVRSFVEGRTLFVDYEAAEADCPIHELPALFAGDCPDDWHALRWENKKQRLGVPGVLKWPITADSARPETVFELRCFGFNIASAIKGPGSLEDGVEFLKSYDIVVHPRCVNVIRELGRYSWKVDKRTGIVLPILEDKENHAIDALRYALEGLRLAGAEAEPDPPPRNPPDYGHQYDEEVSWKGM